MEPHRNIFLVFLMVMGIVSAVIIVPKPTNLKATSASSSSVTLSWGFPINELRDNFTVEVYESSIKIRSLSTNSLQSVVGGLTPGQLYAFVVTASRGQLRSDNAVILQDTVPLPPTNLTLTYFSELLLSIDGVFGKETFNLKFPGVEAVWQGPQLGACDCYEALISPNDGIVARPGAETRILPRCQQTSCSRISPAVFLSNRTATSQSIRPDRTVTSSRRFIHLVPGKTYVISVQSSTCGNGYLGQLKSSFINKTITLPPANPPPVTAIIISNTSIYLSWESSTPIKGNYDGFEINIPSPTDSRITIEETTNPRTRGRNITGLTPCTDYSFQVFTLNQGRRSVNGQLVNVHTKPTPPSNLVVTNFDDTSISVKWKLLNRHSTASFKVMLNGSISMMMPIQAVTADFTNLIPGTTYNVTVTSQCLGSGAIDSDPISVIQATVPSPPKELFAKCETKLSKDDVTSKSSAFSVMEVSWLSPQEGGWDGFVVDYSPYEFQGNVATPSPPVTLGGNTFTLNVSLPVTGRIFSTYVRTKQANVLSKAALIDIICKDFSGDAKRKCQLNPANWKIKITTGNSTHVCFEIINLKISDVTVETSIKPPRSYVTKSKQFCIPSPCKTVTDPRRLKVIVRPICDDNDDSSCKPIIRRYCPEELRENTNIPDDKKNAVPTGKLTQPSLPVPTQACCNGKAFDPSIFRCCHGRVAGIEDDDMHCCYTKWYNRKSQICCRGSNEGIVLPSSSSCP